MAIYATENAAIASEAAKSASSARARKQAIVTAAATSGVQDPCARAAAEAIGRAFPVQAESIHHLRSRFSAAFRRFAQQDANVRSLQIDQPDKIYSELLLLADAEGDYLRLRLEYAERLGFPPVRHT